MIKELKFFSLKYWPLWFILILLRLFVYLPYRWQIKTGAFFGRIAYPFLKRRKHITLTNLRIAFAHMNDKEIKYLCKKCFESIGIAGAETVIAWFMSKKRFSKIKFDIYGVENFEDAHSSTRGSLFLGAHFTCMEIAGRFIGEHYKPFHLVYQKHKNPLFEALMKLSRERYITKCIERKNVISIVKSLKNGNSVWYAPDQDFGAERSIFVPFFDKKCATLVATSWLAEKTQAKVVPCYYVRKPDFLGYDIYILPELNNFPSKDDYQDALRYNHILEKAICDFPDQYLWQHRRYKSRPRGEEFIY